MSTLNIKVAIARKPVSGKPRCIQLLASYEERVTVSNAICYAELGFNQFNELELQRVVKKFAQDARARSIALDVKANAAKMLTA